MDDAKLKNIITPFTKKDPDPVKRQFFDNTRRLMAQMNDGELEHAIKFFFVVDEFLENFEADTGKRAETVHQAFEKKPETARGLSKLIIVTHFVMMEGPKKLLGMSYGTMRMFMQEQGVRRTQASRWIFKKRCQYGI